jgi:DNA-binding transcriptional LysR family regulator
MARRYDLTSLELFVAVCDAKSIAKAADEQSIAASAISKRISQLEGIAGASLITRARSGIVPTRAGMTLLEHARNVLHNVDLIDRDMASDARGLRGYVRVFANASALAEFIPGAIISFLAKPKNSEIDIQVEEMSSQDVVNGVRDGLAPIGICRSEADASGLEWTPYATDHLACVVSAKHPLADRKAVAFADTLEFEHAGLRAASAITALLRRESMHAGRLIRYRVLVSTFEAAIEVVVGSGLVVTIVPVEIAGKRAKADGVHVIPLTDGWAHRQFSICCRARRALPKHAAAFVTHLLESAKT